MTLVVEDGEVDVYAKADVEVDFNAGVISFVVDEVLLVMLKIMY